MSSIRDVATQVMFRQADEDGRMFVWVYGDPVGLAAKFDAVGDMVVVDRVGDQGQREPYTLDRSNVAGWDVGPPLGPPLGY